MCNTKYRAAKYSGTEMWKGYAEMSWHLAFNLRGEKSGKQGNETQSLSVYQTLHLLENSGFQYELNRL